MTFLDKKLFFIDSDSQINDGFLQSHIGAVVAITAKAQAELLKRGIAHVNTIPFFGAEGHKALLNKSVDIIRYIRNNWDYEDEVGIRHAYEKTMIFNLRFYLHFLLMELFVIARSIEQYNPDTIYVVESDMFDKIQFDLSGKFSLLSNLLSAYLNSSNHNAQLKILPGSSQEKNKISIKKYYFIFNYVASLFLSLLNRKGSALLCAADSYNIFQLIDKIKKRKNDVFFIFIRISRKKFKIHLKNFARGRECFFLPVHKETKKSSNYNLVVALQKLKKRIESCHDDTFLFEGVDMRSFLLPFINNSVLQGLDSLSCDIKQLDKTLDKVNPEFSISQYAVGAGYALGELCSLKKLPALLVSHGSHAPQADDFYAQTEWDEHSKTLLNTHFPFVAFQSPLAKQFYDSCKNTFSKGIETGPLLFAQKAQLKDTREQLRQRLYADKANHEIILHAGTPKGVHSFRPWVYESVDEYVRNINDAIETVEEMSGYFLAVRFRPSKDINENDLRYMLRKSDCYQIYSTGSFDEYLLSSDILLSYSSTTIEEAFQNKIPVLLYDPDAKYSHIENSPELTINNKASLNPVYKCFNKSNLSHSFKFMCNLRGQIIDNEMLWKKYTYSVDESLAWYDQIQETVQ